MLLYNLPYILPVVWGGIDEFLFKTKETRAAVPVASDRLTCFRPLRVRLFSWLKTGELLREFTRLGSRARVVKVPNKPTAPLTANTCEYYGCGAAQSARPIA